MDRRWGAGALGGGGVQQTDAQRRKARDGTGLRPATSPRLDGGAQLLRGITTGAVQIPEKQESFALSLPSLRFAT